MKGCAPRLVLGKRNLGNGLLYGFAVSQQLDIVKTEKNPTTEDDVTKDSSVIVISDDDEEMKNASNDPPNIVSATKTPKFQ